MTQPRAFNKSTTYTGDVYTGADLDEDFDNLETTVDETLTNLALIQRDDGALRDASVTPDSLSLTTLALLSSGLLPRGAWAASTLYSIGDLVEVSGSSYAAVTQHIATASFSDDRISGYWTILGQTGIKNVTNIAALTALAVGTLTDGQQVQPGGYYANADGGAGPARIWVAASTATHNGGSVLQPDSAPAAGRWLGPNGYIWTPKEFGAKGDFSADDTTASQATHDNALNVAYPIGNYKISSALELRAFSKVSGAGRSQYLSGSAPSGSNIEGTRIIQTAAAIALRSDLPLGAAQYEGRIHVHDLTVQGRNNATTIGTYGIYNLGAQFFTASRVLATFFKNAGIYIAASVVNMIENCSATYNEQYGIFLDYQADFQPASYNAYMTNIIGGSYTQNGDANIRLGTSSRQVNIIGVDIESAGSFYPAGAGYGVEVPVEIHGLNIIGSWFEGNKKHIVLGSADLTETTIPQNVVISGNQFWSTSGGAEKIRINAGRFITIENNNFLGGGTIYLGSKADNPIIRNNKGNPRVTNVDGDNITYGVSDAANDFPTPLISGWTLTNCTVALEEVTSPAGRVPVFKVTPSGAGLVRIQFVNSGIAPFSAHHTFGCWMKNGVAAEREFGWGLATSSPLTFYAAASVDTFEISDQWKWASIGRSIPSTAGGNFSIAIDHTGTTDPFYITAFQSRPGIVYEPMVVAEPPLLLAQRTTDQTFTASTFTKIGWTTELADTDGWHVTGTFTPKIAGYYQVNASIGLGFAAAGTQSILSAYKNGSEFVRLVDTTDTTGERINGSCVIYCNGTTDYIETFVWSNATTPKITGGGEVNSFSIYLARAK